MLAETQQRVYHFPRHLLVVLLHHTGCLLVFDVEVLIIVYTARLGGQKRLFIKRCFIPCNTYLKTVFFSWILFSPTRQHAAMFAASRQAFRNLMSTMSASKVGNTRPSTSYGMM